MKIFRTLRLMVLALFVSLIPASSYAGVFISVNFAPPVLPVYEQPPCPEPGLMWTPGYWAYDQDGYYWVPGTWVPAPFEGALWTPPYWGWEGGLYMFHPGYWGNHVGYYGGVNYGFGYMGIGFVGGMWRGHDFMYNTAVMHVDRGRFHNTYMDRGSVDRYTVRNDRRVAFSGGPGGINHGPTAEERFAERDRHVEATQFQHSHESAAMGDRSNYFRNNNGRPSNAAVARPLSGGNPGRGNEGRGNFNNAPNANQNNGGNRNMYNAQPNNGNNQNRNFNNQQPNGGNNQNRNFNNQPQNNGMNQNRQAPQSHAVPEQMRTAPQQQRVAPQQQQQVRPAPQPQQQSRPAPQQQQRVAPQQQQQQQRVAPQQQQQRGGGQAQHTEGKGEKEHQH